MKTSLLNRAQSPIPSADTMPQTTIISSPDTTFGFAGLFQKALGWLSPKAPIIDSNSDATTSDNSLLPTGEHQPIFILDAEISIGQDSPDALKINGENIPQKEGGITTTQSNLTKINSPLNSAVILPLKPDNTVESTTNQIDGKFSEIKTINKSNLFQDKNNAIDVVILSDTKKINQFTHQATKHDNNSISDEEHSESNHIQPSITSDSPIQLNDVVASVYSAIQTNIPSENIDITFQSSGKNSAEITLNLPKNAVESKDVSSIQTTDTHQLLETLSYHIDAIQKALGNSVTVKFGIALPNEIDSELPLNNDKVNDGSSVKNEAPKTDLKVEQNEYTLDTTELTNNLISKLTSDKHQNQDVIISETQDSEKSDSSKNTIDKALDKEDVMVEDGIGQDTLARIASVLTTTAVNFPIEQYNVELNESGAVNTPNIPTEKAVVTTEKQQRNGKQINAVPIELEADKTIHETIQSSENLVDELQHNVLSPEATSNATSTNILKNTSTKLTNLTNEVLPAIPLENAEEEPVVIASLTQESSPENAGSFSNGIINDGLSATPKTDATAIPNGITPQLHNSTVVPMPDGNKENDSKTDTFKKTTQPNIATQSSKNSLKDIVSQPIIVSNLQPDKGDSTTIIPEKNRIIEELQKQSFNSVRELLDASSKNGITINSLVIRVETPNVEIPKENVSIIDTSTVNKKDVIVNQQDITAKKPNTILQSNQITDQFNNNVENAELLTIEELNSPKIKDAEKENAPQILALKSESLEKPSKLKVDELQTNSTILDVSKVKNEQSKAIEIDVPKVEIIRPTLEKVEVLSKAVELESSDIEPIPLQSINTKVPTVEALGKVVELESSDIEPIPLQSINTKVPTVEASRKTIEIKSTDVEPIPLQSMNTKVPTLKPLGKVVELESSGIEPIPLQSINTKVPKVKPLGKVVEIESPKMNRDMNQRINTENPNVEESSKAVEMGVPVAESIHQQTINSEIQTVETKDNTVKIDSSQVSNTTSKGVMSDISKVETIGKAVKNEFPNVENKISVSKELNVSKEETGKTEAKIISPKIETTKANTIVIDSPLRETNQKATPNIAPEMASPTIKARDISAVASTQKPIVASKTEPKIEKKVAKTDSLGEISISQSADQTQIKAKEQNPSPQNDSQKKNEKQKPIVDTAKFAASLSNEVQENETVPSKESISNADTIRSKATVESNGNTQTTANLFQTITTPTSKNYNSLDSPKKSLPRVDIDSFAPATAQLVRSLPQQTGGSVRMQLTPDALGPVTVQVNVRDKNAMLRIDVETTAAKQALEAQIPLLREHLSQQGITSDRIEIQVRPREDFSMFSGFNQQNSSARQEEQQARQTYLRSFAEGRDDRQETVAQDILPKVKEKKAVVKNRVEFYA
ncbi:MAG: flagellar hook-length control protein FliK [Bacteroidetes bacterium]|nr:flagellar hook-length control protein FliK [Bacteroidota bacterium]